MRQACAARKGRQHGEDGAEMKILSNDPQNEYYREMYAWRKAHHICVRCGQMDAAKGRVECLSCLEEQCDRPKKPLSTEQQYTNRMRMKRRYDLLTAFGVCIKCGKRNVAPGRAHCNECLLRSRRKDEAKRRKAGIFPRDSSICAFSAVKIRLLTAKSYAANAMKRR